MADSDFRFGVEGDGIVEDDQRVAVGANMSFEVESGGGARSSGSGAVAPARQSPATSGALSAARSWTAECTLSIPV